MNCKTQNLIISAIAVSARIRKDTGGIEDLAADMRERGLINPITVMDCGSGRYQLIAGLRRLNAMKYLGSKEIRATILSPMQADEVLSMEYAENVQRKDFTVVERLEYAEKIKAVERAKALERKSTFARAGHGEEMPDTQDVVVRPHPDMGKSRDAIASKAGFTSGRQYERAETVAAKRPDLLDKIDAGETTIFAAYKQTVSKPLPEEKSSSVSSNAKEAPTIKKQNTSDQVVRAGHDRLMKNMVYSELWAKWQKAVADTNIAVTELTFRSQGYENRIRNYQENIDALSRRCAALEAENAALRARLDETEVAS
jgi:hypothetical protein